MANKRKNYTPEENKIILECIKECLTNTEAFKMAAEKIGRSAKSVELHYYQSKRKHVLALHDNSHVAKKSAISRFIAAVRNVFTL